MVGRASLIVILGFSVIFGIASIRWTQESTKAVTNIQVYYGSTRSHNNALIAANLACDSIFQNNGDTTMSNSGQIKGHMPDGSWYQITTLMVPGTGKSRNVFITATGSDTDMLGNIYNDTVRVLLTPYSFSRYAYFTSTDNGVNWTTGDTLTGPYQTNGNMNVTGVPVFKGPVTIGKYAINSQGKYYPGIALSTWEHDPRLGNYDTINATSFRTGVTDSLPSAFDQNTYGDTTKVFSNPNYADSSHSYDVQLTFDTTNGGSVTSIATTRAHNQIKTDSTYHSYSKTWTYTWTWTWTVVKSDTAKQTISSISNSKTGEALILVNNGDAYVSGTVQGKVSVVASQPSSNARRSYQGSTTYFDGTVAGNILITGPITYKNGTSGTDVLGLVANNSVMLTTQPAGDIKLDAAICALKGSFTYQDYATTSHLGYIKLNGSIIQNSRGAVGKVGGTGYLKNYKYDARYRYISPPGFPLATRYVVLSWCE
jgi:hypothetical protein